MKDSRYIVLRLNHVWGVADNESKQLAGEPCDTEAAANLEAARLNGEAWLAMRPVGVAVMVWGDDWEGRLMAILDRPWLEKMRAAA